MGATALLKDLPIYLAPASIAQLLTVTARRRDEHRLYHRPLKKHPLAPELSPFDGPDNLPFEIEDEVERLASQDNDRWEWHIDPWIRRIEPIALGYLNPQIRRRMNASGLTALLDERCRARGWPEYAITGSNISAVSAGKAAWALLRTSTGEEWAREKYERALNRTYWYIDRAFSSRGTPHEGLLYGLFGLKAVGVLSRLQHDAEEVPVASRFARLRKLPEYMRISAGAVRQFHHHGDSKTVDLDGSFLSYRYHTEGDPQAGFGLYLIGEKNARVRYYNRLYKGGGRTGRSYGELPKEPIWGSAGGYMLDEEVGQMIYRDPFDRVLHVVDAGGGFPVHRLHLGVKPGSRSLWKRNRWLLRDDLYTNALNRWREYDPGVFTAPREASLLERAEFAEVNNDYVRLDGFGWEVKYPQREI